MKKLLKSKEALSPVVAAIILIGVTVAVSIAVAAWMGSLSIGYMELNEMAIIDVEFTLGDVSTGRIALHVTNSGTSAITVDRIRVNSENSLIWSSGTSDTVGAGDDETFTITQAVIVGNKYTITMYTVDGTMVGSYTAAA